jgi:hypothetical protein
LSEGDDGAGVEQVGGRNGAVTSGKQAKSQRKRFISRPDWLYVL